MRKYFYSSVVQINAGNISLSLYYHKHGRQFSTGCVSRHPHFLSAPQTGLQSLSKDVQIRRANLDGTQNLQQRKES